MQIIKHILATAFGIGPNITIPHQHIRDLLRLDSRDYSPTFGGILEIHETLPSVNYGSTRENDNFPAAFSRYESAPGVSKVDQWYNAANLQGKKLRPNREGAKAYSQEKVRNTLSRINKGPQILYNYYENGTWPGPRLAVLIVDELATKQQYGTHMSNVRYGFKAKLAHWDDNKGEYQDIELTHLYINGNYVPMCAKVIEAANDYASRLISMIFRDEEKEYDPELAMHETLERFGKDVFQVSVWQARRRNTKHFQHNNIT